MSAAYFATSEPKARLLTRYSNDNYVGSAAEAYSSAELQQKKVSQHYNSEVFGYCVPKSVEL